MAEHYGFFNYVEGDANEYSASDFAEYFSRFLSDGIYTENGQAGLKVSPGTGLTFNIASGYSYVRGYMYKNDSVMVKALDPADSILERIDRIVIRFDEVAREIKIQVKKGTFSSSPIPPTLIETSTVKELSLAQVKITKGATTITNANITDERFTSHCGLVSSLIDIPIEDMWNIWNGKLSEISTAWNEWFQNRQNDLGSRLVTGSTEPVGMVAGDVWLKEL